jgi:acyl-CoA thioester hydrolase
MARPDPAALDPARYPFSTAVDLRFGDMDVNAHVNNVAFSQLVEEGRVRFHKASGFHKAMQGFNAMVASMGIEYVGQAWYPGSVSIHAGAVRLGASSYDLELLILQDDRPAVFARSTMVCMKDGRPHALPDMFRQSVSDWMVKA